MLFIDGLNSSENRRCGWIFGDIQEQCKMTEEWRQTQGALRIKISLQALQHCRREKREKDGIFTQDRSQGVKSATARGGKVTTDYTRITA